MEKGEEENGGENNPNNTIGDGDTLDSGGNGSDETGVDSAVHVEENGTVVVSNGKTDDNRNKKDTNQEAPEQSDNNPAPDAAEHDTVPPEVPVKTDTSKSKEEPGPGSSSKSPGQSGNNSAPDAAEHDTVTPDVPVKTDTSKSKEEPGPGSSSKKKQNTERGDSDDPDSVEASDPSLYDGTSASDTPEQNQKLELDAGVPGTTQGELSQMVPSAETTVQQKSGSFKEKAEEGDNRAPPPENEQSGLENLESESGFAAPGHAGGRGVEVTEEQTRDANGRSEKEMKTGAGANEDDPKEDRHKEEKAKEEGVQGEGGTEDTVKTEERVVKERSVSISLCTSAYSFNVEGLVSYLKGLMEDHPELIKEVKVHDLPYNDLDHYRFNEKDPVDVMILCHSINNRRFAITDVMDALYDEYLPYCARVIGKEKMGVIVHDFDDMRETVQSSRMSSFKYKQPKAFETTRLQITCGHIEKEEQVLKQMRKADRDKIVGFLERASKYPEEMQKEETKWTESLKRFIPNFSDIKSYVGFGSSGKANEGHIEESIALRSVGSNIPTAVREQKNQDSPNEGTPVDQPAVEGNTEPDPPRGTSPVTQQSPGAVHATAASGTQHAQGAMDLPSQQKMTQNSGKVFTSVPQSSCPTPRPISVSVCSSAYKHNVKGLLSWLTEFQAKQPHMITDVVFRKLPYSNIDSFRFPSNDPVDVMVLCHSVDNRGFSITNVLNALYEKYLKYCNKLIGKKKLAVIVHDFADCTPATVEGRMESFRRMQPLTFELVDTVIICGRLEDPAELGIREEDLTRLICFLELARFEPKENFKQSMFGKLF